MIKFSNEMQYDNSFLGDGDKSCFFAFFSSDDGKYFCRLPSGVDVNSINYLKLYRVWHPSESVGQNNIGWNFEELKESKTPQQKMYRKLYSRILGL